MGDFFFLCEGMDGVLVVGGGLSPRACISPRVRGMIHLVVVYTYDDPTREGMCNLLCHYVPWIRSLCRSYSPTVSWAHFID